MEVLVVYHHVPVACHHVPVACHHVPVAYHQVMEVLVVYYHMSVTCHRMPVTWHHMSVACHQVMVVNHSLLPNRVAASVITQVLHLRVQYHLVDQVRVMTSCDGIHCVLLVIIGIESIPFDTNEQCQPSTSPVSLPLKHFSSDPLLQYSASIDCPLPSSAAKQSSTNSDHTSTTGDSAVSSHGLGEDSDIM